MFGFGTKESNEKKVVKLLMKQRQELKALCQNSHQFNEYKLKEIVCWATQLLLEELRPDTTKEKALNCLLDDLRNNIMRSCVEIPALTLEEKKELLAKFR